MEWAELLKAASALMMLCQLVALLFVMRINRRMIRELRATLSDLTSNEIEIAIQPEAQREGGSTQTSKTQEST